MIEGEIQEADGVRSCFPPLDGKELRGRWGQKGREEEYKQKGHTGIE